MMRNLRIVLKTILLAPISALILVSLIFTFLNYPDLKSVTFKNSNNQDFKMALKNPEFKDYVDNSIAEIISQNSFGSLSKHNAFEILNSTLRISSVSYIDSAVITLTGTGVIIHSDKKLIKKYTIYNSYVLTNRHVVGDSKTVNLEAFHYVEGKFVGEIDSFSGTVILEDSDLDLALIKVVSSREIGHTSHLINPIDIIKITLYEPIFVCGCSLTGPPSITNGNLSNVTFSEFLVSAWATFGNSGGGAFTSDGEILGIVYKMGSIRTPDGQLYPEPNRTYLIPAPLVSQWLRHFQYDF